MRLPALVLTLILALPVAAQEPDPEARFGEAGSTCDPSRGGGRREIDSGYLVHRPRGQSRQALRLQGRQAHGRRVHEHHLPGLQEVRPVAGPAREGIRREGRRASCSSTRPRPTSRTRSRLRRAATSTTPTARSPPRSARPAPPKCSCSTPPARCIIAGRSTTSTASATRSTPREPTTSPPRSTNCSRASCRSSSDHRARAATLDPTAAKAPAVALTYHARIERIVQTNCVECHRKGGVAPFALDDLRRRRRPQGR